MKNKKYPSALVALSLLLPIGAFAQTSSSGTSGTSSSGTTTQSSSGTTSPSSGATSSTREYGSTSSSQAHMGSPEFKRIKEDKLKEEKMTAEHLMGKTIVDREGQTIGKVKDIGLGSVVQEESPTASTSTTTPTTGAGGMTGRASTGMGRTQQINLYVELDDAVGIQGDDLAVIPASSVRFDRGKEELKLQVARSELASKLKQSESGQSSKP